MKKNSLSPLILKENKSHCFHVSLFDKTICVVLSVLFIIFTKGWEENISVLMERIYLVFFHVEKIKQEVFFTQKYIFYFNALLTW